MSEDVKSLRLFVIAPDDVAKERSRIDEVVRLANTTLASRRVRFDLWHWRDDLGPGLHPEGPGALVRGELDEADVVLVVLWNDPGDARDDALGSIDTAVAKWRHGGRPAIFAFRCKRPADFDDEEALEAALVVRKLCKRFAVDGEDVVRTYDTVEAFGDLLFKGLVEEGSKHGHDAAPEVAHATPSDLERHLERIRAEHGSIDLTGLLIGDKGAPSIPLDDVYVSLSASGAGDELAPWGLRHVDDDAFEAILAAAPEGVEAIAKAYADRVSLPERARRGSSDAEMYEAALTVGRHGARRILVLDPQNAAEVRHVFETRPLELVVEANEHLLLEGDPGSGKTTALKRVAVALANARLDAGAAQAATEMRFAPPYPLPVFVALSALAKAIAGEDTPNGQSLERFLCERHGAWLAPILAAGEAVVLFDGLDEVVTGRQRTRVAEVLRDFVRQFAGCRFIVSSRPAGLSDEVRRRLVELGGLGHARVQPLAPTEVRRFVRSWYRALVENRTRADERAADLTRRIEANARVAPLVETPVLLTAVAVVHLNSGQLPERRAVLYEQCIQALAGRIDDHRDVEIGLEHDRRLRVFAQLAYETHGRDEEAQRVERSEVKAAVREQLIAQGSNADESAVHAVAVRLVERSGLLVHEGEASYRFRHLTFQEFLAARWLATQEPDADAAVASHVADARWREVVLLFLGFEGRDGPAPAVRRLERLVEHVGAIADRAERGRAAAVLARAFLDLSRYPEHERYAPRAEAMKPTWVEIVEDPKQTAVLEDRVAIGDALGLHGDPRLEEASRREGGGGRGAQGARRSRVAGRVLEASRRWVEVPAGRYWRGAAPGDEEAYYTEKPAGEVELSAFFVQRWPVTVAEYRPFVAVYGEDRWWSPEGRAWRDEHHVAAPWGWAEQRFANRPVVGVSFWEADAYARWLHHHHPRTGHTIRLPTEAEWEAAVRGPSSGAPASAYPWGPDWAEDRALSDATGVPHAVAVGLFPAGTSRSGLWDAAGNVWEWCLDGHDDRSLPDYAETQHDPDPVARGNNLRVFRGGSYFDDPRDLRVSYRLRIDPGDRFGNLGFRVVASQAPLDP
ncbi:MAG: SUMF1/EgtB/PvdO family nonheme iron enzyme [Deltaproteobacteria bacterium]